MSEIWRSIPSFPEYSASSLGRVKGPRGILSTPKTKGGYLTCSFRCSGVKRTTTVQRLVAEAFLGRAPTQKHEANHKNGKRSDNRPDNLEWVTHAENMAHARHVLGSLIGRKKKERSTVDDRHLITIDLTSAGGQRWTLTPRLGYHAWDLVGADGKTTKRAALKTLLRGLADELPRMLAPRNCQ